MGLRRKYKRLRYLFSWKYPALFRLAQKIAFPLQVGMLCVALYSAVTLYQQHYSFEATMRASQTVDAKISSTRAPLALNEEIPVAAAMPTPLSSSTLVERKSVDNIVEESTDLKSSENADADPITETDQTIASTSTSTSTSDSALLTRTWIMDQNKQSFVIQLATSSNKSELIKFARNLAVPGPLAMYPYKRNSQGDLTYGLSVGLYRSSAEAITAIDSLPGESGQYGSWVRKITDVNAQITALNLQP